MFSKRAVTAARRVPALRRQLVPTRNYATEQSSNPTVRPCVSIIFSFFYCVMIDALPPLA